MSWSYSRYSTYKKCPAKYKFKYVDKLVEPQTFHTSRGLDYHAQIENYLRGNIEELMPELSFYKGFLDVLKQQKVLPELKLQVNENWEPVEENGWFTCIIDAVVIFPSHAIKYDWKTGKIYDDHMMQRELYALALFSHYPLEHVQAIHTYLDSKENRMTTFHRDQVPHLREKWNERAKTLDSGDYAPNPSYACRWCGFSRYKGGPCQF